MKQPRMKDGIDFSTLVCPACQLQTLEKSSDLMIATDPLRYYFRCVSCGLVGHVGWDSIQRKKVKFCCVKTKDEIKKAFLICPVRGVGSETSRKEMEMLELEGWEVHWPPRDTCQEDSTGYRICQDNLKAIKEADCVFIRWDGKSQGCLFDAGMAFALGKKVVVLKAPEVIPGEKSFQAMFREWELRTDIVGGKK